MCGHHRKPNSEVFQAAGSACRFTREVGKLGHTRSKELVQAEAERELISPTHNTESNSGDREQHQRGASLLLDDLAM
jgi:hypothetical protein